jgi:hypothetical protein
MTTYLPKDVRDGLQAARIAQQKKISRLRVEAGAESYKVLRLWNTGFSVETDVVPTLRGLVDLYDGARHLCQCLIIASEAEAGEMRYEFKRNTTAHDKAPLDYTRDPDAPIALLPR